jgi:hypothetical protein
VLAGMLVTIVSTVHLVVRELIDTTPNPTQGATRTYPSEGNSMTQAIY